jgi:Tfp pilus assembly protein PilE
MQSNRPARQRGITLIGFIFVLIVVGFFGYMVMVLGPAYNEYYGVVKAMNTVAGSAQPNTDFQTLRMAMDKQFNVGYVNSVDAKQAKIIRDKTRGNVLHLDYEVRKPFLYNVDFVVKFAHEVPVGSKTAGD